MNQAIKNAVRQISPPIFVTFARSILRREKQTALKTLHAQRNRDAREGEIVLRDDVRLKLHPESRYGWEYFCFRVRETVDELDTFLQRTRDKSRFLDIGAYDGLFSLVFAVGRPGKRVVAVDAGPLGFARLLYNIHKNLATNVHPVECALSDTSGQLRMHYEWDHAVAAEVNNPNASFLTVEKRTGDDLCRSLSFSPDVIKIDVEGHEAKVLKGLSGVVEQHRPLIFLELHPQRIRDEKDSLDDITTFFGSRNYQVRSLDGRNVPTHNGSLARFQHVVLTPS